MRYEVIIKPSAAKQLDRLPGRICQRILEALETLRADPRPQGAIKLVDQEDLWRMRIGAYRVVYTIDDDRLVVLVVRVAHRKGVHRG
jgi:mRNA interferase RelE/StbE